MDISSENLDENIEKLSQSVPVLSEYAKGLENNVKTRYLQKISAIGVDPPTIPSEQFSDEVIPPIEATDLVSYLILETSFYTKKQFKDHRSLEAYNQLVSGFVSSVKGLNVSGKVLVTAKVRHSQRMNDPLIPIWIICEKEGTILSAHCMECMAGLGETCSHVASVLFYIEATVRINGKLACTQEKCSWLPTFVKEVKYDRVEGINFKSSAKLKQELDERIDSSNLKPPRPAPSTQPEAAIPRPTAQEMNDLYEELNKCKVKPVCLSLVEPYADQFVCKSREIPTITDLHDPSNMNLDYVDLIKKCQSVEVKLSDWEIEQIEKDTRKQAKGSAFHKHRAGRIGASVSGDVYRSDPTKPSQSLVKTIVYPSLYNFKTKATQHGIKEESNAVKAYGEIMKDRHKNLNITNCGVIICKEHPYIHATPDFLTSCDCCGLGCGEVKCPLVDSCNLDDYVGKQNSCLEKAGNTVRLKRKHNYYYQVQQQLFVTQRNFCDFVVYLTDNSKTFLVFQERIFPDHNHMQAVLPTLKLFWTICILPEVLSRWYTRKCDIVVNSEPTANSICFCRMPRDSQVISCNNKDCPYGEFHPSCLGFTCSPSRVWICPHCSRLPQFKRKKTAKQCKSMPSKTPVVNGKICICNSVPSATDRLLECHNQHCVNGKFFHLSCIGYKKMPNNSKTTWRCTVCKTLSPIVPDINAITCTSSNNTTVTSTVHTTTCTSYTKTAATLNTTCNSTTSASSNTTSNSTTSATSNTTSNSTTSASSNTTCNFITSASSNTTCNSTTSASSNTTCNSTTSASSNTTCNSTTSATSNTTCNSTTSASSNTTCNSTTSATSNTTCNSTTSASSNTTCNSTTSATSNTTCNSTTSASPVTLHSYTLDSDSDDEVEFSKVSVGQVDKTGGLANLTQDDFELILDPNGWLHSSIIQKAQVLLKNENPLIEGLQKPTLGRVRNFDVISGEFVQILHTGRDHWVCISSIGCLPGQVNLFDSLYNDVILQEVVDQAKDLMAGDFISLEYVPTQQQNNGSDCGVFAIAVATCLVFGIDPKYVTFDIVKMRPHLASCLQTEKIDLFPYF